MADWFAPEPPGPCSVLSLPLLAGDKCGAMTQDTQPYFQPHPPTGPKSSSNQPRPPSGGTQQGGHGQAYYTEGPRKLVSGNNVASMQPTMQSNKPLPPTLNLKV